MILFVSVRPLARAENIKAVWNAWEGPKEFFQTKDYPEHIINPKHGLYSGTYELMVTDDLPSYSPGKCLFIGHGMGAGKLYGLDQPNPYFRNPKLVTAAIASSADMVNVVASYCGISKDQVFAYGMPRTDAYFGHEFKKTHKHLYAPTFRFNQWQPKFDQLSYYMKEGEKLIAKPHMVTGHFSRSVWHNIDVVSSDEISTPYLLEADSVITDYSSIMFDAMVMRKPVILFAKDKDHYLSSRGMYEPYPQFYSDFFFDNEKDLAQYIGEAEWSSMDEVRRNHYVRSCDGHSTERVVNLMKSMMS